MPLRKKKTLLRNTVSNGLVFVLWIVFFEVAEDLRCLFSQNVLGQSG